jgi:hypothetical protein
VAATERKELLRDICIYCKRAVYRGVAIEGEWAHVSGSRWCQTPNGFTATPLRAATPTYHGNEDVL